MFKSISIYSCWNWYNNKKLLNNSAYITGHSLGGVLSLLSGIILSIGNINTYVVTFGQPRVGNDDFNKFNAFLGKMNEFETSALASLLL